MTYKIFSIYLFVMVARPQDYFTFLQPLRPALLLGVLSALALVFSKGGLQLNEVLRLSETIIMIIGIPFSLYRRQAFDFTFLMYSSNILFFFLFILGNNSFDRLRKSMFVIILSAFAYAIFCLSGGSFRDGRFLFGTMFDPNGLAYFFISLLPLSLYFIIHNKGRIKQGIIGLITFGTSILITILTASRAGIIAFMITFITMVFTIKLSINKKILLTSVLIVMSAMYYDRINIDRYSTIVNIEKDYNLTAEEGRLTIWKRSIKIILEHPIIGVGVTCFGEAIGTIRVEMDLPPKWQSAHNSYLEVAGELGLIGLFVFLSMSFGCLKHFYLLSKERGESKFGIELQTISRLLFLSTVGCLVGASFLSE